MGRRLQGSKVYPVFECALSALVEMAIILDDLLQFEQYSTVYAEVEEAYPEFLIPHQFRRF
ncbi:MAG: hypothetical protein CSA33_08080 [Desulfobulbus propionicus]|nr:MAG: hypothetical protein CSA33_08080 [Desulfobulbus propionicus]